MFIKKIVQIDIIFILTYIMLVCYGTAYIMLVFYGTAHPHCSKCLSHTCVFSSIDHVLVLLT